MNSLDQLVDDVARSKGVEIPELPSDDPVDDKPISKSQRVRDFLEENPDAKNRDVAETLAEFGVNPADVANVKAQEKRKAEKKKRQHIVTRPAEKNGESETAKALSDSMPIDAAIQLDLLEAGVEFIRKSGGLNEALHVLSVIRRIRQL